jgi:alanyl-tRNA synthetase
MIKEVIDFLTKIIHLSKDSLIATTFMGGKIGNKDYAKDYESLDVWKIGGISEEKIIQLGVEQNFLLTKSNNEFAGSRTEIFYQLSGPENRPLVCMEVATIQLLEYTTSYTDGLLKLMPLPYPIAGMALGVERIMMAQQNVDSIYEIYDIRQLKDIIEMEINNKYLCIINQTEINIIADHLRAIAYIAEEGQTPDNTSRGKILKKLIDGLKKNARLLNIHKDGFYDKAIKCLRSSNGLSDDLLDKFLLFVLS